MERRSLKSAGLRSRYRSSRDNLVSQFYVPALRASIRYRRAVGYFSSDSLVLAAQGVAHLIHSGGTMQIVASPHLRQEDVEALRRGHDDSVMMEIGRRSLASISSQLVHDRLAALEWLVRCGRLKISLALCIDDHGEVTTGLYHEKMGIFDDAQGERVVFNGSMNETGAGLTSNFESINVFFSWSDPHDRIADMTADFEELWNNRAPHLKVIPFTEASHELLEVYAVDSPPCSDPLEHVTVQVERQFEPIKAPPGLELRPHQKEAVAAWVAAKGRGIFAMATGAGKTISSLACVQALCQRRHDATIIVVILVPFLVLLEQWRRELVRWSVEPVCCFGSRASWLEDAHALLRELRVSARKFGCIVTTNKTFAGKPFQSLLIDMPPVAMIIADEVHNLGATRLQASLTTRFKARLGLSATPDRHGDPDGSQSILEYFGGRVFSYSLADALGAEPPVLCPYDYWPIPIPLTEDEMLRYEELTVKVGRAIAAGARVDEPNDRLLALLLQRARLLGGAANKLGALMTEMQPYLELDKTLVYCGDGSVEFDSLANEFDLPVVGEMVVIRQVEAVAIALTQAGMRVATYTSRISMAERAERLRQFECGEVQALVAIRCLDEGVDLPDVRRAFILASSTNPRQYVQRRGRVLRRAPGKTYAEIYDFVALPDVGSVPDQSMQGIVERELSRVTEFCDTAQNRWGARDRLRPLLRAYKMEHL